MMEGRPSSHDPARLPMPLKPLPPDESAPEPERAPPVPAPEEADDFEYEVEEADPAVTAHVEAMAKRQLDEARQAIDVDSVYRELDRTGDLELGDLNFKFRFGVRSLLVLTTLVAVALTIGRTALFSGGTLALLIVLTIAALGGTHVWLGVRERRRRAEIVARREEQLRRARKGAGRAFEEEEDEEEPARSAASEGNLFPGLGSARFGLSELLLAFVASSVVLAGLSLAGSVVHAAAGLGALALTGFALQAADVDVPRIAVLTFWLALFGYVLLTLMTAVAGAV